MTKHKEIYFCGGNEARLIEHTDRDGRNGMEGKNLEKWPYGRNKHVLK